MRKNLHTYKKNFASAYDNLMEKCTFFLFSQHFLQHVNFQFKNYMQTTTTKINLKKYKIVEKRRFMARNYVYVYRMFMQLKNYK